MSPASLLDGSAFDPWKGDGVPFHFLYGGVGSEDLLSGWERTQENEEQAGRSLRRLHFRDPVTRLRVTAEVVTFADFPAVEWVLRFANEGTAPTPLLERIRPLAWEIAAGEEKAELHHALGGEAMSNDFDARTTPLRPGGFHRLASAGGRSSLGSLPFFNLQVGEGGVIGAIGWTGNWEARFGRDHAGVVHLAAGMPRTRLRLEPGEEIRTPSVVLLPWKGDRADAHNVWRRLLLAHYVPRIDGAPALLPSCYCVWGTERSERHVERVEKLAAARIPVDVYWIDAGWYGNQPMVENGDVFNTAWGKNRGSWRPAAECYPEGFRPLSTALGKVGMGLLLWFEIEVADKESDLWTEHPDWFFSNRWLLNLGNPETRRGLVDLVSKAVGEHGLAWYRQDFNHDPENNWADADAPDRIGMSEIGHIDGLYRFWDELRARHPRLMIDNCSSGGRRIDIETLRRSVPLWRSDYQCNPTFNPVGSQRHTAGLAPWVPLSAGVVGWPDTYALRSAYSAGLVIEGGMCGPKEFPEEWLRPALEEFREVRPYFYGDYYPVKPFHIFDAGWVAWQLDRPDLASGIVVVLCRRHFPQEKCELKLRAIDAEARYDVEIRHGLGPCEPVAMTGSELATLALTIAERPASVVVFYRKKQ